MPEFGRASKERLAGVCREGEEILCDAIQIIDFSIIETVRSKKKQDHYYSAGASTLKWPESKHNTTKDRPKAEAWDVWPYVSRYGALSGHPDQIKMIAEKENCSIPDAKEFAYKAFARVAGVMEACGYARGYRVRWGGDWDGDGNMLDQNFNDLPHFEIVRG